ncbi:uncharacterized protein BDR25DRAFT_255489, partial [Lindgomyces ingoldianus]
MAMATLIFIPGHWNTPACYDALITALFAYGYNSATVLLPSVDCDAATYSLTHELDALKATLAALARIRRDVILILHPSLKYQRPSMKGYGEKKRAERSLKTGVVRMIFFMAFIGPEGFNATKCGDAEVMRDFAKFELERGIVAVDRADSMNVFFQYLPASEAQHWAARLLPQSVGVFWSASNYTGWRNIPSTYMLFSDDR